MEVLCKWRMTVGVASSLVQVKRNHERRRLRKLEAEVVKADLKWLSPTKKAIQDCSKR